MSKKNVQTKTMKKCVLLSAIMAVIVVAATVLGIFFGFNAVPTLSDGKKVTVTVGQYLYATESSKNDVKSACDDAFADLHVLYCMDGDSGNDGELVYAFGKDEDVSAAVTALQATFDGWTGENGKYATHTLLVSVSDEKVVTATPDGYILRGAIACAVIAVLAFGYVTLRYQWRKGLVAGIATAAAMLCTSAILVLTRIPVSASAMYAVAASGLLTVISTLFFFNKVRKAQKEGDAKAAELVRGSVAYKETFFFAAVLCVAILLVCLPVGISAAWFALSTIVGLAVSVFLGVVYAPALFLPLQEREDELKASATKYGYKGAEKSEKTEVSALDNE